MSVYIVTGKLGNGKTLASVGRIMEYIERGSRIATNLDLYLEHYPKLKNDNRNILRIPDKPNIEDLESIGRGAPEGTYNESRFGLLVLDECGTWFNSRNWNDKGRKEVNDWFLHSRKLGWDVMLIIQSIKILDSQARETLAEYTVFCRRLDKMRIPVLSPLVKALTGINVTLPRLHFATVKYGTDSTYPTSDRWYYRGTWLYSLYDTQQVFSSENNGVHSYLSPWMFAGRHSSPANLLTILKHYIEYPIKAAAYLTVLSFALVSGRSPGTMCETWAVNSKYLRHKKKRRQSLPDYPRSYVLQRHLTPYVSS